MLRANKGYSKKKIRESVIGFESEEICVSFNKV